MINFMKPDAVRPWQKVIISRRETYCCLEGTPRQTTIQSHPQNIKKSWTLEHSFPLCVLRHAAEMFYLSFFLMQRSGKVNPKEIEDARWFTRAEVRQMLQQQHPQGLFVPW